MFCSARRCLIKIKYLAQHFIVFHLLVEMLDRLQTCLTLLDARMRIRFFVPAQLFVNVAWLLTNQGSSAFLNIFQTKIEPIFKQLRRIEWVRHASSDFEENEFDPSDIFALIIKKWRTEILKMITSLLHQFDKHAHI